VSARRAAVRLATAASMFVAVTAAASVAIEAQASLEVSSSMRKQVAEGKVTGRELYRGIRFSYKGEPLSGLALVSARIEDGRVTAMASPEPYMQDPPLGEVVPLGETGVKYPEKGTWLEPDAKVPAEVRIPVPFYLPAGALIRELSKGEDKVINTIFDNVGFDIHEGVVYLLAVVPANGKEMEAFETAPLFVVRKKPGRTK